MTTILYIGDDRPDSVCVCVCMNCWYNGSFQLFSCGLLSNSVLSCCYSPQKQVQLAVFTLLVKLASKHILHSVLCKQSNIKTAPELYSILVSIVERFDEHVYNNNMVLCVEIYIQLHCSRWLLVYTLTS